MKYKTKSIIIGRKKRGADSYPCFVHFFDINDPHKTGEVPTKMLDFEKCHKVSIKGLDVDYLLEGNDLVINDLVEVDLEEKDMHLTITGTHT